MMTKLILNKIYFIELILVEVKVIFTCFNYSHIFLHHN